VKRREEERREEERSVRIGVKFGRSNMSGYDRVIAME
jgi:hypothetical protein